MPHPLPLLWRRAPWRMGTALRVAAAALLPSAAPLPAPAGGGACVRWRAFDNATGTGVPQTRTPLFVGNLTAEGNSCSKKQCPVWPVQICTPQAGTPVVGHRNWGPKGGNCSGGRPEEMHHCQKCWMPPREGNASFWLATPGDEPLVWVRLRAGDTAPVDAVAIAPGVVLGRSPPLFAGDVMPGGVSLSAARVLGNITCEHYGQYTGTEFDVATCAPAKGGPAKWVWPTVAVAAAGAVAAGAAFAITRRRGAAKQRREEGEQDADSDEEGGEAGRARSRVQRVCAEAVAGPRHVSVRLPAPGDGGEEDGGGCAEVEVDCRLSAQDRTLIEERVARALPQWRGRVRLLRADAARHDPYRGEREEALRAAVSDACAAPVLPLLKGMVSARVTGDEHLFSFPDGVRLSPGQRFVIVQRYKGKLRRLRGVSVTLADDVFRSEQLRTTVDFTT